MLKNYFRILSLSSPLPKSFKSEFQSFLSNPNASYPSYKTQVIKKEPQVVNNISTNVHDATSYFDEEKNEYAKSPLHSVYIGKSFELLCIQKLTSMGFTLEHTGKSGDGGIDFKGKWKEANMSIIGQCKRIKTSVSIKIVREFHSVLQQQNLIKKHVGWLMTTQKLSKPALEYAMSIDEPLMICQLLPSASVDHREQMLGMRMNQKLEQMYPEIIIKSVFNEQTLQTEMLPFLLKDENVY